MSSPCLGTVDLLQSPSMGCFAYHPMWKLSHKSETEACLQTQSKVAYNRGSQNALPSKCVVHQI